MCVKCLEPRVSAEVLVGRVGPLSEQCGNEGTFTKLWVGLKGTSEGETPQD